MEVTCEQNEYRKNYKENINQTSKEMGGKYETVTGHLTKYLTGRIIHTL
jgi:hypothetical protein